MTVVIDPKALTTIEAVRDLVLRNSADESKDDALTRLINQVSATVRRYCPRQFFPDDGATYVFDYDGSEFLDLTPYELRNVSLVTMTPAGAATPITLDPARPDYRLRPAQRSEEGTYTWMRLLPMDNPRAWPPRMAVGMGTEVSITGDWGMETYPSDVEEATLVGIKWRWNNQSGAKNVNSGDLQLQAQPVVGPLPLESIRILENIKRPDIGV